MNVYLFGKYIDGKVKFVYATIDRDKAYEFIKKSQNKYIFWRVNLDNEEDQK